MPDEKAMRERVTYLVQLHGDMIYRLAYQQTGSTADAEDVYGDVCLAMLTKNAPLFDDDHIRHWLVRVTINRSHNLMNAFHRKRSLPLEKAADLSTSENESILDEVMSLPPKYRTAVYLHYYEGYSIAEIADIMHAKPATVGTWLSRARKQLKIMLEEDD